MAEITASMVKELREMTGAGMMDCKKALNETGGNMDEAVEFLRKNGQAKAEKKASRIAAEGICRIATEGDNVAAVVEVNSETDFVAKNETFQQFVEAVAKQAVKTNAKDIDAFMAESWIEDSSKTVQEALVDKIAVIGEKLHQRERRIPALRLLLRHVDHRTGRRLAHGQTLHVGIIGCAGRLNFL